MATYVTGFLRPRGALLGSVRRVCMACQLRIRTASSQSGGRLIRPSLQRYRRRRDFQFGTICDFRTRACCVHWTHPSSVDLADNRGMQDTIESLSAALASAHRRSPPRRLHGAHPERCRPADAGSPRPRTGHHRVLPRVHQVSGGRIRELRVRRLAARSGRDALRSLDGTHRRPLRHEGQPRLGHAGPAARQRGGAPAGAQAGLDGNGGVRGNDPRLPDPVQAFNRASRIESVIIAPLVSRRATSDGSRCRRMRVGLRGRVATGARRSDGAPGHTGAASEPARRAEPRRGTAAGGARGTQPDGARHSRYAGAGIRRDPDAAPGGAAIRRRAAAGRRQDA